MGYVAERLAEIASTPSKPHGRVERETSRHGKTVYYYREGKGKRIRLPDKDAVPEAVFQSAYELAVQGVKASKPKRTSVSAPKRQPGRPGYVYFVRAKTSVKIGFTTNIRSRVSQIQTGSSDDLELLMVMPATDETEKFLHELFKDFRIGGEWFSLTGLLADFVGYTA